MRAKVSRETCQLLRKLHAEAGRAPDSERIQRDIETVARLTKILFGDPAQSGDGEG